MDDTCDIFLPSFVLTMPHLTKGETPGGVQQLTAVCDQSARLKGKPAGRKAASTGLEGDQTKGAAGGDPHLAVTFREGCRGPWATGNRTWEETLDGGQPGIKGQQLAVLCEGHDSRGLTSYCAVQ